MSAHRRGFMLVLSLLAVSLLLVLGLGLLGSQSARYRSARRSSEASQAKGMALAGLEDARTKLQLDFGFPPEQGLGQKVYSYSEDATGWSTGATPLSYSVSVDMEYARPPVEVIRVTSVGVVGPRQTPLAQRVIRAELDVASKRPAGVPNPRYGRWLRLEDEGGY